MGRVAGAGGRGRRWVRPVGAVLGYAIMAGLVWRAVDVPSFLRGIAALTTSGLLAISAVTVVHVAGRALRFHRLMLGCQPREYRWTDGVRIFLAGLTASSVTPARAGDLIKAGLVQPHGLGATTGVGLVMVERVLDLLVAASCIVVMGALLPREAASGPWRVLAFFVLAAVLALVVALRARAVRAPLLGALARLAARVKRARSTGAELERRLGGAFQVWDRILASPETFAAYWAYSLAVWVLEFLRLWLVLRLMGTTVAPSIVLFVYPVSILAGALTLLPCSEGVVGVTGAALLASLGGLDGGTAAVAVVVDRVAANVPPLVLWALFAGARAVPARRRWIEACTRVL